ncbi:transposase [Alteromonas mediterranea U8]|nr:transposase [Alteromonas mediterranea U8]
MISFLLNDRWDYRTLTIKPFVIGRKNWLFSQTATGANASAILYSITETAKANDLNVFEYVMDCLEQLSRPDTDIEQLLHGSLLNDRWDYRTLTHGHCPKQKENTMP